MPEINAINVNTTKLTDTQKAEIRKAVIEHHKHKKNELQRTPNNDCFVCNNHEDIDNMGNGALGSPAKIMASFNPATAMAAATGLIVAFEKLAEAGFKVYDMFVERFGKPANKEEEAALRAALEPKVA